MISTVIDDSYGVFKIYTKKDYLIFNKAVIYEEIYYDFLEKFINKITSLNLKIWLI